MPWVRSSLLCVALAALALIASSNSAGAQQRVGVNSAVNPDVSGLPPGAPARQLVLGGDVVFKERSQRMRRDRRRSCSSTNPR